MFRSLKDTILGLRHVIVPPAILIAVVAIYSRSDPPQPSLTFGGMFVCGAIAYGFTGLGFSLLRPYRLQAPRWWKRCQGMARVLWMTYVVLLALGSMKLQLYPDDESLRAGFPVGLVALGVTSILALPSARLSFGDRMAAVAFLAGLCVLVFQVGGSEVAWGVFVACLSVGTGAMTAAIDPERNCLRELFSPRVFGGPGPSGPQRS